MDNLEKYNQAFMSTFKIGPDELDDEFTFAKARGWDSLAHLELIASLEDAFGVFLEPDEITHFGSYEHGKEILAAHGIEVA